MAKVLCVSNQKGGVGKSASCANLGCALSMQGHTVLLVDLDPQAGLTTSLGYDPDSFEKTTYTALVDGEHTPISSVIIQTTIPKLALAPANLDLAGAEAELIGEIGWDRTLKDILSPLKHQFDYIVIDCPPSLGVLTANALVASELALIPLQTEYLAMRGIKQLQKIITKIRKRSNPKLATRIIITMFDKRTLHAKEVLEEIKKVFGDQVSPIIIKRSIKFADSSVAGKPLVHLDPNFEASLAYQALAREVSKL